MASTFEIVSTTVLSVMVIGGFYYLNKKLNRLDGEFLMMVKYSDALTAKFCALEQK